MNVTDSPLQAEEILEEKVQHLPVHIDKSLRRVKKNASKLPSVGLPRRKMKKKK